MKKTLCFALIATILLLPSFSLAANVGETLVLGILSTRTNEIRPLTPLERDIMSIYGVVYESLVYIDDNGTPQPLLAEKWSESGNGQTWTFTLRPDITFSDGTPLTANDVAASCQYILDLSKDKEAADNGFYQTIRYYVSSIRAENEDTVVVKANRGYYGLLYAMTFPVIRADQLDAPSPVGTGPYVISAFEPTSYLLLNANDAWWQQDPMVREIMVSFYSSNKDMITAYEYGRVNAVFTRSVAAAQYKSGISSLSIPYSTRQLEVLLINHLSYPLESVNIRKAIRHAIDIESISKNVYMGMTIDAPTPISAQSWLYLDQESAYRYDPEKAAKLLEEEGWTDTDGDGVLDKILDGEKKNLRLRIFVYEDPVNNVRVETANMIADMLGALKIKAVPTTMTFADAKEKLLVASFDLALCAFQMDVAPDAGFLLMKGNESAGNYGRYRSSEMTTLFNTLRESERREDFYYTWSSIQQRFAEDVPFISLFYRSGAILTRLMYTSVRDIRELELLRGIASFGI